MIGTFYGGPGRHIEFPTPRTYAAWAAQHEHSTAALVRDSRVTAQTVLFLTCGFSNLGLEKKLENRISGEPAVFRRTVFPII